MMMNDEKVCPVEKAGALDSWYRKILQNPKRMLKKHITKGMKVLDFGCGPGFFTLEAAKMVGKTGKVIAADLQQGMLDIVQNKIKGSDLEDIVSLHKCEADSIGLSDDIDFIIAIYVVHETPDPDNTFREMYDLLNPGGKVLSIDPKMHFSREGFRQMIESVKKIGFKVIDDSTTLMNYKAVLEK